MRDAAQIITRIRRHPEWGLAIAREIDVATDESLDTKELLGLAERLNVSRVIFATPLPSLTPAPT